MFLTVNTAEYLPVDDSGNSSGVGDEVAYTLTIDNNGTLTLSSVTPGISEVKQRTLYNVQGNHSNKKTKLR